MSAQSFSYPLRPGKYVDRGLFVELLQYVDRSSPVREAVYVGFGGPCMEDHRVIHAALGLKRMISIENDEDVFEQQLFNKPLSRIVCVQRDAKDFVDEFERELKECGVKAEERRIIWFDFEKAKDMMSQLQTLQALIGLANDGDVIRITLNAHAASLGSKEDKEADEELQKARLKKLTERLGDFLPAGVEASSMTKSGFPPVVLETIKLSANRAAGESSRIFLPLLIVHYADGQDMLTVTGIVLDETDVKKFLKATGLGRWPHYAKTWTNVERVSQAPALTLRERIHMDQTMSANRNKLPPKLKYLSRTLDTTESDLVKMYRRYQRFFPRFQHVDL